MAFLRFIVYPFSLLYALVTWVRNKLFDWHILHSKSFSIPVLSIGNLSTGGTGKTPHVEYLIRLLQNEVRIASLSRGYKRTSKGFVIADQNTPVGDIGDESFQIKNRFPNIVVAVDEKRRRGIENLLLIDNPPEVVILDDAFQHRYVKPGLNILLSDYYHLYTNDYPLPTGNLREFRMGAKRADIIIVTKSPHVLSPIVRRDVLQKINPMKGQAVYFSFVNHGKPTVFPGLDIPGEIILKDKRVILITGIANPYPIKIYIKERCISLKHLRFNDHHNFTDRDMDKILLLWAQNLAKNKVIITTEKDMMRLLQDRLFNKIKHLPLYYLPMEIEFHKNDKQMFDEKIRAYVRKNSGNS